LHAGDIEVTIRGIESAVLRARTESARSHPPRQLRQQRSAGGGLRRRSDENPHVRPRFNAIIGAFMPNKTAKMFIHNFTFVEQ
jgi:hypothetical protein